MKEKRRHWTCLAFLLAIASPWSCSSEDPPQNKHVKDASVDDSKQGWIYTPTSGKTYGSRLALGRDGSYLLGGYIYGEAKFGSKLVGAKGKFSVFILKLSRAGKLDWIETVAGSDQLFLSGMANDSRGNIYIAGYFSDAVTFGSHSLSSDGKGNTGNDIYIARLNKNRAFDFAYSFGSKKQKWLGADYADALAVDPEDNIVLTGDLQGEVRLGPYKLSTGYFISKYDSGGSLVWARNILGSVHIRGGLCTDRNGDIIINGRFSGRGPQDLNTDSPGKYEGFVSKLNKEGKYTWSSKFEGNNVSGCATDSNNNIYVQPVPGGFTKLSPSGKVMKVSRPCSVTNGKSANGGGISVNNAGEVLLHGETYGDIACGKKSYPMYFGNTNNYVMKAQEQGNLLNIWRIGNTNHYLGAMIRAANSIVVAGTFRRVGIFNGRQLKKQFESNTLFVWKIAEP